MKTFEEIKKLKKSSQSIKTLFKELIPEWSENREIYDKIRLGFVQGGSNGWYPDNEILIHFEAWCGTYGDSSTYNQINIDGDVFKKHFLGYLNKNKMQIMMSIAESIDEEAISLKEKAEEEVKSQLAELAELDNDTQER